MRQVNVTAYQQQWPILFQAEAELLAPIFGNNLISIHHIGSTAVPGLPAKPIIDMLIVVQSITDTHIVLSAMTALGYEFKGENGISGRRYFQKGGNIRTHHVHVYDVKNPHIERHLAFRDYLQVHPHTAVKYGALKKKLAQQFPRDIESYIKGKDAIVKQIEQAALAWYRTNNRSMK